MTPLIGVLGELLTTLGGGSALAGAGALGSLAGTGVSLGETIAHSSGSTPQITAPPPATPVTTPAVSPQAVAATSSNNQAATGGAFGSSPDYLATLNQLIQSGGGINV